MLGRRQLYRLLSVVVSSVLTVLLIEIAFRAIGFDFDRKSRALAEIPIFYRVPYVPSGEAFYRRAGPDRWEGQAVATMLRRRGAPESMIPAEPVLSIDYDADGFRNPEDLGRWSIVVVGDSFTELGYLAYEDPATGKGCSVVLHRVGDAGRGGARSWLDSTSSGI